MKMTAIKRIMAAGVLCSVLFTGCGMSDNAADMAKEISVPTLNTKKDIDAMLAEIQSEETVEENWILNKEKQKKIKGLYDVIKAEEEKGALNTDTDEKDIKEWVETSDPKDDAFDATVCWNLEVETESKLKSLFQKFDEIGYTGGYDMLCKELAEGKKGVEEGESRSWWPDISITIDNVTFYITFFDVPFATVNISINTDGIRYPSSLQEILENKLQSGFLVSKIYTGGYLQAVSFYSELSLEGSPYNKSGILYLKDGKAVQLDMYIQLPEEITALQKEGKLEGKFNGKMDTFFSEQESKALTGLLELFGVNGSEALEFAQKAGTGSDSRGIMNDASWQLKENALPRPYSLEKNWLLRIQ